MLNKHFICSIKFNNLNNTHTKKVSLQKCHKMVVDVFKAGLHVSCVIGPYRGLLAPTSDRALACQASATYSGRFQKTERLIIAQTRETQPLNLLKGR